MEFPPLTRYVKHAPFDGHFFGVIAAFNGLMALGIASLLRKGYKHLNATQSPDFQPGAFPWWGWTGAGIMLIGWLLAWTRFGWFHFVQAHTFCLPWIGYILLANAWCLRRSGRSLMTHETGRFLMLFPTSAMFWWFFEYLNRFVQNWYYLGVNHYSPLEYVVHASVAFSTVLPAVMSTQRLLRTFEPLKTGLSALTRIALPSGKRPAILVLLISAAALSLMGRFPDLLYPLVWAAPLLVVTSLQTLAGHKTIFWKLRSGNWAGLISAALAALICGFFWELWNYKSLARWEYSIPFVDCCHIFAMPLLGYGGYLPFGLECLAIGEMVLKKASYWTKAPIHGI